MNEESLMENLTLTMKVAKPHTIDPLEGHTVVIFETVGEAGEEYRFEIEPGQTRPKTKLNLFEVLRGRKAPNYFAYAVTGLPELQWTFTTDVVLDIQAHTFTLLVTLAYSVGEPRVLVTRRNDDPIRKVREKIADMLVREFAQRRWTEIRYDFRVVEREVVAATLDPLRQYAAFFGIRIHNISLSHRLQEIDFADILDDEAAENAKARAQREGEGARVVIAETAHTKALEEKLQHDAELQRKEREQQLTTLALTHTLDRRPHEALLAGHRRADEVADAWADAAVIAIKVAGGAIHTPAELMDALHYMRSAADQLNALGDGSTPARGFLNARSNGQSGASTLITEAFLETERMGLSLTRKQQLQSAVLHLVAELLLDGDGRPAVVDEYAERIDALRAELKLPIEHFDYLKKFVNHELLGESLR